MLDVNLYSALKDGDEKGALEAINKAEEDSKLLLACATFAIFRSFIWPNNIYEPDYKKTEEKHILKALELLKKLNFNFDGSDELEYLNTLGGPSYYDYYRTFLSYALLCSKAVVLRLLEYGADIKFTGRSSVDFIQNLFPIYEGLYEPLNDRYHPKLNDYDTLEFANLCIDSGADVNPGVKYREGNFICDSYTPLMGASTFSSIDTLKFLLDSGAIVNAWHIKFFRTHYSYHTSIYYDVYDGLTALSYIFNRKSYDYERPALLIKYGACLDQNPPLLVKDYKNCKVNIEYQESYSQSKSMYFETPIYSVDAAPENNLNTEEKIIKYLQNNKNFEHCKILYKSLGLKFKPIEDYSNIERVVSDKYVEYAKKMVAPILFYRNILGRFATNPKLNNQVLDNQLENESKNETIIRPEKLLNR
jgi:hypothetical protein